MLTVRSLLAPSISGPAGRYQDRQHHLPPSLSGPSYQKGPFDASGAPMGCKSACTVDILAGDADSPPNCCTGTHSMPATCPPSGVRNYAYFKNNYPNAYAYVYDDAGESPLESSSSKKAAYTIIFCP